jgi:hypothetical protein
VSEEVEHRADSLFALPRVPRTATLLGELPGWERDLADRRIEQVERGADVVVAAGDRLEEALRVDAPAVVIDGPRTAAGALHAAGFTTTRLLPIPVSGSPVVYADLARRRAARYGIERIIVHPERWRTLRNRVAGLAILAGLPLPTARLVTLGMREPGPPALLTGARELRIAPDAPWVMLISKGSVVRRNAFFVFGKRGADPENVLKFSRVPGLFEAFDREQRGFELAAAAGPTVTAHATRFVGRFVVDGHHASVESAAVGTKLATLLRRPGSQAAKLEVLDRVARWLIAVAGDTAAPPQALADQREHYAREVVPFWAAEGAPAGLVDALPPVPAAFQHNDMAEENLIMDRSDFRALDWEWANARGLPLGDLVYFGVHVLRLLDGVTSDEPAQRDAHFARLLAGEAPSSPVLFGWIRDAVVALGLPPESLGPMVTLAWLERGRISRVERLRAESVGGEPLGLPFGERAAKLWLEHPALGPRWTAWHR